MTAAFSAALARRNDGGYVPLGPLAALQRGRCVPTGDVRGQGCIEMYLKIKILQFPLFGGQTPYLGHFEEFWA